MGLFGMASDWIIIGAMLVLGAVIVLYMRSNTEDDATGGQNPNTRTTKTVTGK